MSSIRSSDCGKMIKVSALLEMFFNWKVSNFNWEYSAVQQTQQFSSSANLGIQHFSQIWFHKQQISTESQIIQHDLSPFKW